jgi:hypothetical protein
MSFEFEVTRDLPAKPGNGQRTGGSAKAESVNSLAICVLSQGPEKET